jgi:murein DD-endopeptidase MepM/ murein hydrolase activator NlpD
VLDTTQGKILAPPSSTGPTVAEVVRDYQSRQINDAVANRYGWNCRVHLRHEGAPGVDWYLPTGTPVIATMRGTAELYFVTTTNAYTHYGVDPRVTLGLPAPTAPRYPLPGPGGGLGVFVSIVSGNLRAEVGHLDPDLTLTVVPDRAFIAPYSRDFNYRSRFAPLLAPNQFTLVASWPVVEGEVIGFVGNTGYSDVPHLHYHILTRDRKSFYCPTREALPMSGWLFGRPENFR